MIPGSCSGTATTGGGLSARPPFFRLGGRWPLAGILADREVFLWIRSKSPAGWRSWDRRRTPQRAYTLALQAAGCPPEEELEAASYLLFSKGDYRVAYTSFLSLYRRGLFQKERWS